MEVRQGEGGCPGSPPFSLLTVTLAKEDDELMQIFFSKMLVITTTVSGTGKSVLFYFSDVQKE